MEFNIRACYNFDLLNALNVLTGDPFYADRHPRLYAEFGEPLSEEGRLILKKITDGLGNAMISPPVAFSISIFDDFEDAVLSSLLLDEESILNELEQKEPGLVEQAQNLLPLFRMLAPVIAELENMGFAEYWQQECLPDILKKKAELEPFAREVNLDEEIAAMLGANRTPEAITLYLCAYAAPHGIKIYGPRYIADISFSKETIFGIAVHEMFHPPYEDDEVRETLDALANDPFIKLAFEKKDPKYGYPEMDGFLEENVVEAMALQITHKTGLEPDPFAYLQKHDDGSHVFSVILLDYMQRHPKAPEERFADYFQDLVAKMPVGNLAEAYQTALRNAGKTISV